MKCPKCHYLSFDPEPRCRNCGYTLALDDVDVAINATGPESEPLADLTLRGDALAPDVAAALDALDEPAFVSLPPKHRRRVAAARGPFDEPETPATGPAPPPSRDTDFDRDRELDASPAILDAEPEFLTEDHDDDRDRADIRAQGPAGADADEEDEEEDEEAAEDEHAAADVEDDEDDAPAVAPVPPRPARLPAPPTGELPLFVKGIAAAEAASTHTVDDPFGGDSPLISLPAEPRAPLAVRKPLAEPAARPSRFAGVVNEAPGRAGPLDRDLLEGLQRIETAELREEDAVVRAAREADRVGLVSRFGAAAFDAALLGSLSFGVLWVTLRFCDLPFAAVGALPAAPTAAFLLLVGLGYLLMFTAAGGQTIGKMLFGIRVVAEGRAGVAELLPVRQAIYREVIALPSILALGLGFVPALLGDERALHDRIAHTRVVRA
jgi:uncharacterized RDD family membrane protein YckC